MFDTLRFATRLKRSGFENDQAEGMARALAEEMGKLLERLSTKADLAAMKNEIEAQIAALSARLEALEAKVDALAMQMRFMFAMLAVVLALGLIDTVPGMLG